MLNYAQKYEVSHKLRENFKVKSFQKIARCWRDSSVGKVFALVVQGPKFNPQNPCKNNNIVA